MADIPVISIEIDDAQYRAFEERVKQFRAEESEAPGAWEGTAEQIEIIKRRFEEMSRAAGSGAAAARDTEASAKSTIGTFSDGAAVAWDLMRPLVRGTAHTIAGAARDLAKWERAAAVVGGLLGAGSLIGLDRLAEKASARRRQATGLGVSTGQLAAFQTDFGRLGDTDSLLRGFNTAATDQLARQPLQSLGVDARGKNATQLFAEALPRVKELVDRIDPKMMGPTLIDSYHLDRLGFSEETLRLIRRMKRSEIQQMLSGARHDAPGFDIPDDIGRKWTDLVNQLTVAGNRIETALAGSLVNIAPGVTHVSESLVRLTDALLSQPQFTQWLGETADGVEKLAGWIGSSEAQKSLRHAVDQIKIGGGDLRRFETWLSDHPGTLRALGGAAVGVVRGSVIAGPVGAVVGAAVGAGAGYISHDDAPGEIERRRQESLRHSDAAGQRQRAAGAAAERPTLAERNAERSGLGLKPYASQQDYDKAEPVASPPPAGTPQRSGMSGPESLIDRDIAGDLSGGATYPRKGEHIDPAAFIVHHTGSRGTPEGVVQTLNQRGLGVQYVMDRDGKIYRALPDGSRGAHILRSEVKGLDLSNDNTIGMEVIAKDDADVTPAEVAAAKHFYGDLQKRYPGIGVYGHGYVNPGHKQATEGKTIVDAIRAEQHQAPDAPRDPVKAAADSGSKVPLAQRGFMGAYAGRDDKPSADIMKNHPNNRPPPAPVVHVTDNTGGASQVSVHQ